MTTATVRISLNSTSLSHFCILCLSIALVEPARSADSRPLDSAHGFRSYVCTSFLFKHADSISPKPHRLRSRTVIGGNVGLAPWLEGLTSTIDVDIVQCRYARLTTALIESSEIDATNVFEKSIMHSRALSGT